MKKFLIASGVAVLAFASVAGAQSFMANLMVGSTGADVVALQTVLVNSGFLTMPAGVSMGYFGSRTQAAVKLYQASKGVPNTGFVGPLTRAALNGGGVVATTPASWQCPVGYTCTANPGTVSPPVVGGPTGITTPGVPGIMSVTAGPLSSSVLNVGAQMAPVLTIRVQAQYSDLDVQSLNLALGNNTAVYNKLFNKIYVTDGTNVLASLALNGSNVVQSGSEYIAGVAGFHFIVPKGAYRDLILKADLNSSIDSAYISSSGASFPDGSPVAQNSINATLFSGWGIGLQASGVRAVDGAGINLNAPGTGFYQGLTINPSLIDNAQANVSLSSDSPLVASIPVTDTTNGQYLGLPVLKFDVNAQNDSLHLRTVVAKIYTLSGSTGSIGAAYLFNGTTQIASASVSGNTATFSNITNGTAGASVPRDTTGHFTIKVDATGVTSGTLGVRAGVATSTSADLTILSSNDSTVTVSGSAQGNTQTVASVGPLFTLVGTPTIAKSTISDQNGVNSTSTYTATFNVNVQAVGAAVNFGLLSSSTPSFATSTTRFDVYKNGTLDSMTNYTSNGNSVISGYAQPTGTSLSSDSTYFTLGQNQSVTIPVTYSWVVRNASNNQYAGQLQGIQWYTTSAAGPTTFMLNQPLWRTGNI